MNLLLNASNLRHGGGKTVALQLINGVAPLRPADTIYVIAPQKSGFESLADHPNVKLLPLPDSFHRSWLSKLRHMHGVFPGWCKRLEIDKIVSLGNAAFPAQHRPQLVYIQLPQIVYHESAAWKLMDMKAFLINSLMDQYVALHMRYASAYAVQTEVMKTRLIGRFKLPDELVFTIPNAPVEPTFHEIKPLQFPLQPLRLLFLSRYYPHKSFESLPAIAALLKEKNLPVRITLTINEKESPAAAKVLRDLKGSEHIVNMGPVPLKDISTVVSGHHGIFHPSLMESFSGAYAEALLHRRLIFTSHYDFATEMLGDAAFYFDPLKPEHIVSVIESAIQDETLMREKLRLIDQAALSAPRIDEVARNFSKIIDTFA